MKLTVYHAAHRCEPCRDMHGRIALALAAYALATGFDASSLVEFIDVDAEPDRAPHDLAVVPLLVAAGDRGVYFRSDGRVPSDVVLDLLAMMAEGVELPRAAGEEFDPEAPSAAPVFYRTYSRRRDDGSRETWEQMVDRCVDGIADLGRFTEDEHALVWEQAMDRHALPSGRWLWVGGTEWIKDPSNFSGAYNCTSTTIDSPEAFGYLLELAMMGSGTGAVLEDDTVAKLPPIARRLELIKVSPIGKRKKGGRDDTRIEVVDGIHLVKVGDSRQGWVDAYQAVIDLAMAPGDDVRLIIDLSQIRPIGAPLKGFGGRANPVRLPQMFERMVAVLNQAAGRQLTPMEACLLIDEGAACIVAGNIRRSAGMRQFSAGNEAAQTAKLNLYVQDGAGAWKVDSEREALRMANHTRVFHHTPTLDEIREAVALQFSSGEGAIQYAPEALARANADLLDYPDMRALFLEEYAAGRGRDFLCSLLDASGIEITKEEKDRELDHRMARYGLNPCLTGDTRILTVHHGPVSFQELTERGEDVLVWCVNKETNEAAVRMMRNPRVTGYDVPVLEVEFDSGLKVRATPDHNFFTLQRNKVQAKDLEVGQSVAAFALHQHRDGHLRAVRNDKTTDTVRQQFAHRVVAEFYGISGEVIHHRNGDPLDNAPENLEATTAQAHNREHFPSRSRAGFYHGRPGPKALEHIANHKVVAVREAGTADVFNGTVDEFHNYVVVDPSPVGKSYVSGILSANCGEIIGTDFHCNLAEVHLNTIDPKDLEAQEAAFGAAALEVAALLRHTFRHDRYSYSREIDPIVGVSFTGLFDFFVQAFGVDWLQWFAAGRPEEGSFRDQEAQYLAHWRTIVDETVAAYCGAHGLLCPNRCTTVQPAGTKSLLTGASSGWHPPKAARFIRRITFGAHDPVALAAIDAGYSVVPSQSCRDDDGNLLDDPFDPRATEWLVEIPTAVTWADLPGADQVDLSKLPATAQFDFYMVVQQHYTAHNTSATIELREEEIEPLAQAIHGAIGNGYISAALLARFDVDGGTFPRLPFEPISRERYQELHDDVAARHRMTFRQALELHDRADLELTPQEAACTSGACIARAEADEREGKG